MLRQDDLAQTWIVHAEVVSTTDLAFLQLRAGEQGRGTIPFLMNKSKRRHHQTPSFFFLGSRGKGVSMKVSGLICARGADGVFTGFDHPNLERILASAR